MAASAWLMLSFSSCIVWGFDSYTVLFKCPQRKFLWGHLKSTVYESNLRTIQELKDNISHADAAVKITMLHRVYLNMVTAQLLTNCSNTLRNTHTNARENITRTRAKCKVGYFFVVYPLLYNCWEKRTNSKEESSSREANRSIASQEISRLSCNPKVYYRIHKRLVSVLVLRQINAVHFLKIHFYA